MAKAKKYEDGGDIRSSGSAALRSRPVGGLDTAADKSGRTMPTLPVRGSSPTDRPAVPPTSNAAGAMRGLDRAAAMSGRTMPTVGKPVGMKKGGSVGSASKRADGIATKGKTKGKIV